jgi:hypothetical protein
MQVIRRAVGAPWMRSASNGSRASAHGTGRGDNACKRNQNWQRTTLRPHWVGSRVGIYSGRPFVDSHWRRQMSNIFASVERAV